jgi:hypothetical protein
LRGLLAALVEVLPVLIGIIAVVAQVILTSNIMRQAPSPNWDGIQTWYQAERIRSGEPLCRPQPSYGPHVMAGHMEGYEPFSMTESPHLSAVMLAALLFNPLCWNLYLAVSFVPLALWMGVEAFRRSGSAPGRLERGRSGRCGSVDVEAERS